MKASLKLLALALSCISISLHCAEKRLNPDKVIQAWQNEDVIDTITASILLQPQESYMKEQGQSFFKSTIQDYIDANQLVPARIIDNADTDSAELAQRHNEELQKHYQYFEQLNLPQG